MPTRSTRSSRRSAHERHHLRPRRFRRAGARRRTRSPRRSSARLAAARHRREDRAQRLARRLFPGADGRGGDRQGPRRLWPGRRPRTSRRCSTAASSTAARTRSRSAIPRSIPFLAKQTRLTFARCGITDPLSLDDYEAHDGLKGLAQGRGDGAGRHRQGSHRVRPARPRRRRLPDRHQVEDGARHGRATSKYIVCNADEGDSGTFADRMIMEGDPFVLIEGMAIAGIAIGATKGYVYIRSEYPHAAAIMNEAIAVARQRRRARQQRARLGASPSTWRCASAPAPMSAARRPRCWNRSKASAAWCAPSRRCRRTRACSASRPSSTTSSRSPRCRSSSTRAARSTRISAWAARAARSRSRSPATSGMAGCSRRPSA